MKIGPSFGDELKAAGLAGLPFVWSEDGNFTYDASMSKSQVVAVQAVIAAHDPLKPQSKSPLALTLEAAQTINDLKAVLREMLR